RLPGAVVDGGAADAGTSVGTLLRGLAAFSVVTGTTRAPAAPAVAMSANRSRPGRASCPLGRRAQEARPWARRTGHRGARGRWSAPLDAAPGALSASVST